MNEEREVVGYCVGDGTIAVCVRCATASDLEGDLIFRGDEWGTGQVGPCRCRDCGVKLDVVAV